MEGPTANKRPRSAETNGENEDCRTITLDMSKYGEWVRKLTPEELVSIFEIGLKIKESVLLTVDVSQDFLKKTLTSQMEPVATSIEKEVKLQLQAVQEGVTRGVSEQVTKMSSEVQSFKSDVKADIQNIGQEFQRKVNDVVNKASSLKTLDEQIDRSEKRLTEKMTTAATNYNEQVTSSEKRLTEKMTTAATNYNEQVTSSEKRLTEHITTTVKACNEQLTKISSSLGMSHVKGSVGEVQVMNVLKENFPHFTTTDTSKQPRSGDILVETSRQNKIMIEVKNRESSSVPQKEIDRFKGNLANSPDIKVGILFSMKSGIANKASNGKFQVKFDDNQYQIYVPNAGRQETLIVWSVLLADELAKALPGELGSSQDQMLKQLYNDFEESKQFEQKCRDSLKSLEKSTESVTDSLNAILKTVENTRKKLKSLLND